MSTHFPVALVESFMVGNARLKEGDYDVQPWPSGRAQPAVKVLLRGGE